MLVRGVKVRPSAIFDRVDRVDLSFFSTQVHRDNYVDLKCPAHAGWTYSLLVPDTSGNPQFIEGVGKRHVDAPLLSRIERDKMSELHRWYLSRFAVVQPESGNNVVEEHQEEQNTTRIRTWSSVKDRDFCDLTVEVRTLIATDGLRNH